MTLGSGLDRILAIDAGNSRIKWAVYAGAGIDAMPEALGIWANPELAQVQVPEAWKRCRRAIISIVAGAAVAEMLSDLLQRRAIEPHWVVPEESSNGLRNGYADPRQLGSDRWAAAVAAWHRYRAPCIVATAGTALTVDAIREESPGQGIFLGGLIIPGFSLMQQSLNQKTAGLPAQAGSLQDFPANTADAIHSGILNAMAGAVHSMAHKLHRLAGEKPYCLLGGGDAPLLAQALEAQPDFPRIPIVVDNLVLQGLLLIEREYL